MVSNEKGIVRRDGALIEDCERRLQLGRPRCKANKGPLLRISYDRPLAILKRKRNTRLGKGGAARKYTCPQQESGLSGPFYKASPAHIKRMLSHLTAPPPPI